MSDDTWHSCCIVMDRKAAIYFTQLFISLIIIAFCLIMLFLHPDDCNKEATYIGLLTFTIGVHLPNPKFDRISSGSPQRVPRADPSGPNIMITTDTP